MESKLLLSLLRLIAVSLFTIITMTACPELEPEANDSTPEATEEVDTSSTDGPDLDSGSNTLYIYVTDDAGNVGHTTFTITRI